MKNKLYNNYFLIIILIIFISAIFYFIGWEGGITGFATYTVGSGQTYSSLEHCLFYINGTADSCTLSVSNYQETFGSKTFLNSVRSLSNNSLRVAYGFEEGSGTIVLDSSNNKHNGTINFTGVWTPTIHTNLGLTFNGKNATVNTTQALFSTTDTDHSYSAWININQLPSAGTYMSIITQGEPFNAPSISMYIDENGKLNCISSGGSWTTSTPTLSTNTWYHAVCVFDNTNNQIYTYVNGKTPDDCGVCTVGSPNDDILEIGGTRLSTGGAIYYFNGTIDEIAVWNNTLTAVQIQQLAWGSQYKYNLLNGGITATDLSNVSLDFNGTYFMGNNIGNGINMVYSGDTGITNLTIKNVYVDSFGTGLELYSNNLTLINITSVNNQIEEGISIGKSSSASINSTLINVNSSNNLKENLKISSDHLANIRDSWFYNSGGNCVNINSNNITFVDNKVKDCLVDNMVGINAINGNKFLLIANNTFENNNVNAFFVMINSTIINNTFGTTYDTSFSGLGYGGNIIFLNSLQNNIINNTFENSVDSGLLLYDGNVNNTITGNIFKNTTKGNNQIDLWMRDAETNKNTQIWLNHFYTNVSAIGTAISWCVNDEGNFYGENINKARINESDCGLLNITSANNTKYNSGDAISINWTKQSSIYPLSYLIYLNGLNLANTTELGYNLDSSSLTEGDYGITIRVNDGYAYGTNKSMIFSIAALPVVAATTGGGGGGGGGGSGGNSYPRLTSEFKTDKQSITTQLSLQETKTEEITIQNENQDIISMELYLDKDIAGLIDLSETTFNLNPSETKIIKIKIKSSENTGIYIGNLILKSNNLEKKIPLIIEIQSKSRQIDANLDLAGESKKVNPGDDISAQITLFNIGESENLLVQINYIIKSIDGKEIMREKEELNLNKQTSFNKKFSLPPDIKEGEYIMGLEVLQGNAVSISTQLFEVAPKEKAIWLPTKKEMIYFVIINIVFITLFIIIIRFFRKKFFISH